MEPYPADNSEEFFLPIGGSIEELERVIQYFATHYRWSTEQTLSLTYSRRMRQIKLQEAHLARERERIR